MDTFSTGKIYRIRRREPEGKPYFGERYIVFSKVGDITENRYTRWVDYYFLEDPDRILYRDVVDMNEQYEIEEVDG